MLDEKLGFPKYLNTLNSFRNPDILTGDPRKVLPGNKYRAKMVTEEDEKQEIEEENSKRRQNISEGNDSEDSKDATNAEPDHPSRYYHKESNSIR